MKQWLVGLIIMIIAGIWIYFNYISIMDSLVLGNISSILMNPFLTLLPQVFWIIGFVVFVIGLLKK